MWLTKLNLLVIISIIATFAFLASSASAFEWWVNGATLEGRSETMALTAERSIEIAFARVPLRCTAATSQGAVIQNKAEFNWRELKLETCTVPGRPECTVRGGEVKFAVAEGLLKILAFIPMVHPEQTAYGSFTIEGATCGIRNSYTMTGLIELILREPEREANPKIFRVYRAQSVMTLEPGGERGEMIGELRARATTNNWKVRDAASSPTFRTQNGGELLFSGEGTKPILRGEQVGVIATVECEKILVDGFALHESPLAHRVLTSLRGKCVQKIGSGANETCEEPIEAKRMLAELGLLTSTNHKVVLLLAPSDGTTTFAVIKCGGGSTTIGGVLVGEIPAKNTKGEEQLNKLRSEIEIVFAANKTDHQAITEIFLLETQMTKNELSITGFSGGPASEEASASLKGAGTIEVNTTG